ncbi:MAG: galactose mutarotase [Candidatus Obscuribacterales bacterium]|nr:galactose mutarotase [Candidatus Obscuribacterales bacterium]
MKKLFGSLPDGREVYEYTLANKNGMTVKVINYGAIIAECWVPDKNGKAENVVLGFDNLEQYLVKHPRFGSTIGRYANRIGGAQFELDGTLYKLAANNGSNCIHGGLKGFDKQLWDITEMKSDEAHSLVRMYYVSKDMEEGFPGNLSVQIDFSVHADNTLQLTYKATSDKATPLNLTNHSYFNLQAAGNGNILAHSAQFNSDSYTPLDSNSIPTGEFASVGNTAYDFRNETEIGALIDKTAGGYDINYIVGNNSLIYDDTRVELESNLKNIANIHCKSSGRKLAVYSDQPGFQFFTANSLDGSIIGNGGSYQKHAGFCIETQHFADSVHHQNFPNTILRPKQIFLSSTRYKFHT